MQQILVYSDSLSWGIIPNTRRRLNFVERWPGAMEDQLIRAGAPWRDRGLPERPRTAWDDPSSPA